MNSSVNVHKVKNSAKSQGKLSSNTSASKQIAATDLTAASRSSHYATGVVPGFAAPVQTQAVQRQVEQEQETGNEDSSLQMMCSECAAEQEESESDSATAVQMWSCGDYPEPTCAIQNKEAPDEDGELIQESKAPALVSADDDQEEQHPQTPVQQKCAACDAEEQQEIQKKDDRTSSAKPGSNSRRKASILNQASEGLKNAHGSLPYQERIQTAFGHHDISGVQTEVGGSAARASERMGAQAYASGNKIGFRRTPSLHLAAHEAAHTVQQRAGLKLPGNMGTPGDPWERHADRVADAVVAGESAEALLDTVAPSPAKPKAHNPIGATKGQTAPARGDGIAPQVQGRITSGSAHQIEPELAEEEAATGDGTGAETAEGGGSGAEAAAEPEAVEEADEAAEENDSDPAEDCALAEGEGEAGAEPEANTSEAAGGAGGEEAEAAPGGSSQKGRCYSATAEDPPEGSEEPANDSPPNESQAEAEVTYGEWAESNDSCECAAADAIAQQTGGANSSESVMSSELPEPMATESPTSEAGGDAGGAMSSGGGAPPSSGADGAGAVPEAPADFSQNEATRDAAVAELDAATAEVAAVPSQALNLSRGLDFRGAVSGNAAQEAARAMALSQIRAFMLNAAQQMNGAVSFVTSEVPTRLGGMADAVIAGIDASMAEQKSAISARIAGARMAAAGEAASARNAIEQEYATHVELVNAETDAALEYLNSVYTSSTSDLALAEDTALGEVNQRFAEGRIWHEEAGQAYANRAIATGQDWVSSFDHCRAGSGNDNEYNGDDGFWDGCLTVRRAQAQQKAACSTASGFAKNMIDMGKKKGFELREQRTQYRCMLIAGAGQAQSTMDTTLASLVSGLESGRNGTLSGLAEVRRMNLDAVDAALAGTLQSLNRQEREQRQAVNDSGYIQQMAVEELAHQVAAGLARSVSAAMETLEQTLQQLREQLLEGDVPPPDVLQQALLSAEAGLSGGLGTLLDKMEEGAASAESQLLEAGANAASSLTEITNGNDSMTAEAESGLSGQLSALVGAASSALSQLSERQVSRAQESATQGGETMEQLVSGFTSTCEQVYTSVDGVITTSLTELDTELKNMEDGLDAKIAAEAWRAASKEQPAWKAVVAIVLIVLVIIASIVVTVLTLGAGAPLLAVVLVGAVVGAVTAGLIQIINNWAAGEEWDKGLVQAMVIGAVGGALGGAIGAGANGLAQVALQGAIRAGASTLTRAAINIGINLAGDLVAEAATQTFSYFAYGQKFNWQGFVMAGGMSMLSTARGGIAGSASPHGSAPHARADAPAPTAPSRGAMSYATDASIGMGFALAVEGVNVLAGGEFDLNRFATSAAGAGGASRAAAMGNAAGRGRSGSPDTGAPAPTPRTTAPDTPPAPPTGRPHTDAPGTSTPRPETPAVAPAAPTRAVAPDADLPPGLRSSSDPEPAVPSVRSETDSAPGVRPTGDEAATPRTTEAEGTPPTRPVDEGADPTVRPATNEAETPRSRSSHEDVPEIEPGVVARIELGDGHAVTILRDGRIILCSVCGDLRMKYASELSDPLNVAHRNELDRIERITDPQAKADAAVQLRSRLELLRSSGISRPPAGATDGATLARAAGLPDAPTGYHWAIQGDGVEIQRNPGGVDANNPPLRYDAESRSFVPDIEAPPGYHWARKPNGGYTVRRNPGTSGNIPELEFDAARSRFIDPSNGNVYQPPVGPGQRPTWRQSEVEVGNRLGNTYSDQVSFIGGKEVPHGTAGSTRPDHYSPGPPPHSVEVKNYDVETPQGRQALVDNVTNQARGRAVEMPANTRQSVYIDVRGQNISPAQLAQLKSDIAAGSGGHININDIHIIR